MEGWRDGSPAGRSERRRSRLSGCAPGLSRGRASEVGRGVQGCGGCAVMKRGGGGSEKGCARRRGCGCGAEGPDRGFLRVRALASMQALLLAKRTPAWMWRTVWKAERSRSTVSFSLRRVELSETMKWRCRGRGRIRCRIRFFRRCCEESVCPAGRQSVLRLRLVLTEQADDESGVDGWTVRGTGGVGGLRVERRQAGG
jgi:hypothetical protein